MTKMKTALLITAASLGVAAAQTTTTQAVKPSPAKITSATLLVTQVTENGKSVEKLVDASKGVFPGNTLVFRQTLENLSGRKLTGVQLAMPIPGTVTYLSQQCSVTPAKVQYSVDAHVLNAKTKVITNINTRKYGAAPLMKTVIVKENGVDVKKEVQAVAADYTAVRWQLPDLNAGQTVECSARVKVK